MSGYIMKLRQYLRLECACVRSRGGKGGVYDYTQKKFAFNSIRRAGGVLSEKNVCRIYDTGCFYADSPDKMFIAKDIIEADGCFNAVRFCIDNMDELITPEYVEEVHSRLYAGTPLCMSRDLRALVREYAREPVAGDPAVLREVAEFHSRFIQYGGDSRTAELISYMQCINNYTTPFIIHAENQTEYENRVHEPDRLEQFFRMEQMRYKQDTKPMVIEIR